MGIPLISGILFNHNFPALTQKIVRPIKRLSILIFSVIVVIALVKNFDHFLLAIQFIFLIVLVHNAVALGTGYLLGALFKRPVQDRRTLAIETGIQNSGLALVLIFNPKIFPPEMELGGMAIIAAWWGIWHIISGITIAGLWTKFNFGLKQANSKEA
jgi:BASS family bile acid:Na+ symporter